MVAKRKALSASQERKEGLRTEALIIEWLRTWYPLVLNSTPVENIKYDIDCWVRKNDDKWSSISIKVNNPEYYESPFIFELSQEFMDDKEESGSVVVDGWYYTGRADITLVWKRDTHNTGDVWVLFNSLVKEHVAKSGFDEQRVQKKEVREREAVEGKLGAKLGLLRASTIVNNNLGKKYGRVEFR